MVRRGGPYGWSVDWSVGSPRTRSVVGVRGPEVIVFGLPIIKRSCCLSGPEEISGSHAQSLLTSTFQLVCSNIQLHKLKRTLRGNLPLLTKRKCSSYKFVGSAMHNYREKE